MKPILSSLLIFVGFLAQSQELIETYPLDRLRNNTIALHYQDSDSLLHSLFIEKKRAVLLDHNAELDVIHENEIEIPKRRRIDHFIGHLSTDNHLVRIYYANDRYNKFSVLELDPSTNSAELKELDFQLKKQTFLHSLTHEGKFYILSFDLNKNLILHKLDDDTVDSVIFSTENFEYKSDPKAYTYDMGKALKTGGSRSIGTSIVEVLEENLPNSIEQVSREGKLIKKDNRVFILVDHDDARTDVVEISLSEMTFEAKSFEQPTEVFDLSETIKSNSYLHEDKLYQIVVSKDHMTLSVKDYHTKEEIKRFEVSKDDEAIPFSNTPITQLGGAYDNYRELDKTKQLLRKMTNSFPGVIAHRNGNQLELTIGGSKEVQGDAGMMILSGIAMGAAMGSVGNNGGAYIDLSYNPFMTSYYSGVNSKSVYIIGLFNDDLNHMIGEIPYNIWDDIESYLKDKDPYHEDIFMYKESVYYSYHDRDTSKYYLVKF